MDKILDKMHKLASELVKEWNKETFNQIFRLADNDEFDIFVAEIEDGICIEDDVYYYKWK